MDLLEKQMQSLNAKLQESLPPAMEDYEQKMERYRREDRERQQKFDERWELLCKKQRESYEQVRKSFSNLIQSIREYQVSDPSSVAPQVFDGKSEQKLELVKSDSSSVAPQVFDEMPQKKIELEGSYLQGKTEEIVEKVNPFIADSLKLPCFINDLNSEPHSVVTSYTPNNLKPTPTFRSPITTSPSSLLHHHPCSDCSESSDKPIGDPKAQLSTIPVHVVNENSQIPVEFLNTSVEKKFISEFECEGADLCPRGAPCGMQLAFPDSVFAIRDGNMLIRVRKIALESRYIPGVIHQFKRDSEALCYQFGINVFDNQNAYYPIEKHLAEKEIEVLPQDHNFWTNLPKHSSKDAVDILPIHCYIPEDKNALKGEVIRLVELIGRGSEMDNDSKQKKKGKKGTYESSIDYDSDTLARMALFGESDCSIDESSPLWKFGRFKSIARVKMKWLGTEAELCSGIVPFIKRADEDKHLALSHQMTNEEALQLESCIAECSGNRENTYKEIGRVSEAILAYIWAITTRPTMAEAHAKLTSAHKDNGHVVWLLRYRSFIVSIIVSFSLAVNCRIAVATMGMLSTIAIGTFSDAYGPIRFYASVAGLYYHIHTANIGSQDTVVSYNDKLKGLLGRKHHWVEQLEILQYIEVDAAKLATIMLSRTFLEYLISGNSECSKAESVIHSVEDVFFKGQHPICQPLFRFQRLSNWIDKSERGKSCFNPINGLYPSNGNSALAYYIRIHQDELILDGKLQLVVLFSKKTFQQLRIVDKLGFLQCQRVIKISQSLSHYMLQQQFILLAPQSLQQQFINDLERKMLGMLLSNETMGFRERWLNTDGWFRLQNPFLFTVFQLQIPWKRMSALDASWEEQAMDNPGKFQHVWQVQFTAFIHSWGQECSEGEGIVMTMKGNYLVIN